MHIMARHRRSWWVARAFGRNLLLRPTDRIEACVIVSAILLALAATPFCAAAGLAVYGSHVRLYAEQAHARHTVAATVIQAGSQIHAPHTTGIAIRAMWPVDAGVRTHWYRTNRAVKAGDRIDIWVDRAGSPADPPTPASQAGIDAVGVGAAIWCAVALGLTACVAIARSPLNRIRLAGWEREIRSLVDGGHTNTGG
jgi:hypothetical protein